MLWEKQCETGTKDGCAEGRNKERNRTQIKEEDGRTRIITSMK
jgi:hypothetical protein